MSHGPARLYIENQSVIDYLSESRFFSDLSKEAIDKIVPHAKIASFSPGDEILTEGDKNETLYILLFGNLNVYVDNKEVARITQQGDLLGEMSIINGEPCSATIICETPVNLLSLDAREIKKLTGDHGKQIQSTLYRIFAAILTQKLKATNERAKESERLSLELNIAKETLKSSNIKLEKKFRKERNI